MVFLDDDNDGCTAAECFYECCGTCPHNVYSEYNSLSDSEKYGDGYIKEDYSCD